MPPIAKALGSHLRRRWPFAGVGACWLAFALACEAPASLGDWLRGGTSEESRSVSGWPVASGSPAPRRERAPLRPVPASSHRFEPPSRVVAIGDLHGNLAAAEAALRLAGAIDGQSRWVGQDLVVVQTGNRLGPGGRGREVAALFSRLAGDAQRDGGRVVTLLGEREAQALERRGRPDRAQPVAVIVGNTAFVHAGLLPRHVQRGLALLNREVVAWGRKGAAPELFHDPRGPLKISDYTYAFVPKATCKRLDEVLRVLRVDRLVAGHARQKWGISAFCNRRLYRIDVGLSLPRGVGRLEVLEITPGRARTLKAEPE